MNLKNITKTLGMCTLLVNATAVADTADNASQKSLYAHLKNNKMSGDLSHNIASFAGAPRTTSPLVFNSDMTAETGLTKADFFDTAVGDLDGDGKDEIINFYFDDTDDQLKINILSPNSKTEKNQSLYTTSLKPVLNKKFTDTGICAWIQVETFDSNGDNLDDILVSQYCGEVKIWKAKNNNALLHGYSLSQSITTDTQHKDKVTIATGNIDNDAQDELVIGYSWKAELPASAKSYPYVVLHNLTRSGRIATKNTRFIEIPVDQDSSMNYDDFLRISPFAITIANIDSDPLNEVIIGGGPVTYIGPNNRDMLTVGYLDPDNSSNSIADAGWGTQAFFWTNDSGEWSFSRQSFTEIVAWDAFNWGQGSLIVYGNAILQYNWDEADDPEAYLHMVNEKLYHASPNFPTDKNYYKASIAAANIAHLETADDERPELYVMPYKVRQDKEDNVRRYHSADYRSYLLSVSDNIKDLYPTPVNLSKEAMLFEAGFLNKSGGNKYYFDIDYSTEWMLTHPRPVFGDF